jgi:ADP-heptose:LPS heptosyltransferase
MTKKILFITSTRIGDAVLSMGILSYILRAYPDSRLTIACGPLVESLFQGVPNLDRIIVLKKLSWKRHWIKLWAETVATPWDTVIDLRNSAVSRLIYKKNSYIHGASIDKTVHKVAQNAAVIGVKESDSIPQLFPTSAQMEKARQIIPDGTPVLGLGPTANWIGKMWPVENFQELAARLQSGACAGWRIAVFGAPNEEEVACQLYNALPESIRINVIAKGTPGDAAACLSRLALYIGNDSGLMHSAAAAGVPTIGLFGPTNDKVYGAYGKKTAIVRTPETMDELIGYKEFNPKTITDTLMRGLSVDKVEGAVIGLLSR